MKGKNIYHDVNTGELRVTELGLFPDVDRPATLTETTIQNIREFRLSDLASKAKNIFSQLIDGHASERQ